MQGYIIKEVGHYGFDEDLGYFMNYKKALQVFNDSARAELKRVAGDVVSREDFSEEIENFRKWNKDEETEWICRTYPLLIFKKRGNLFCRLFFWGPCSYEYNECDIETTDIVLKSIEIVC